MIYQATITANMAWTGDGVWKLADGPDRVLQLGGISSDDKELSPDAFNKIVAKLVDLAKAYSLGTPRRPKRKLTAALAFTGTPDNGSAV